MYDGDAFSSDSDSVSIRLVNETDSFEDLTDLLHAAYARLAAMGLRYMATDQGVDVTRGRAQKAECYIALLEGVLVGRSLLCDQRRG